MSIYHLTYLVNRKNGSKNLLPDLMKNGINCDLRVLQVGDLLWIAREKTACMQSNVQQNILLNVQDFFNFMILHLRISSTQKSYCGYDQTGCNPCTLFRPPIKLAAMIYMEYCLKWPYTLTIFTLISFKSVEKFAAQFIFYKLEKVR